MISFAHMSVALRQAIKFRLARREVDAVFAQSTAAA
jgi:hypothetical protein